MTKANYTYVEITDAHSKPRGQWMVYDKKSSYHNVHPIATFYNKLYMKQFVDMLNLRDEG